MTWLHHSVQSPATGKASSARLVAVVAGLTLSLCCLLMTIGLFFKDAFATPLAVSVPFLAAMAGANYVTNKLTGDKKNDSGG